MTDTAGAQVSSPRSPAPRSPAPPPPRPPVPVPEPVEEQAAAIASLSRRRVVPQRSRRWPFWVVPALAFVIGTATGLAVKVVDPTRSEEYRSLLASANERIDQANDRILELDKNADDAPADLSARAAELDEREAAIEEREAQLKEAEDDTAARKAAPVAKAPPQPAPEPEPAPAPAPAPAPVPEPEPEPELSIGQEQALRTAQQYLETMPFSRAGLIEQLTSPYGSQFDLADATYAVDNVQVDWNAEAAEAAQQYLETMAFSRAGLIEQLTSPYGSQFTQAEAEYAVSQVGF